MAIATWRDGPAFVAKDSIAVILVVAATFGGSWLQHYLMMSLTLS